ncbi:MAG: ferredoxin [Actinoallomurus sp.]|jgi:ferredoxin|nr:ferredoxin [Actinoallomurus sp.]
MAWLLLVNPITCTGHGICAELFPEAISLDEWGYPILGAVPDRLLPLARRAVADCPTLALMLERDGKS